MKGKFIIEEKGKPAIKRSWADNKPTIDAYALDKKENQKQQKKLK